MKFLCAKAELLDAVLACLRAVPVRTTQSILKGILIEADEDLKLTSYDTAIGIDAHCFAEVREKGKLVINAKILGDIVRKMPDAMLEFEQIEDGLVRLSCGSAQFQLKALTAESYPRLPDVESDGQHEIRIKQADLKAMISKTIASVSTDSSRPNLNGALLSCHAEGAEMVGIDGYRLALYRVKKNGDEGEWPEISFIIPGKTLRELMGILNDDKESELSIFANDKHIVFLFDSVRLISSLINGEFLNYKNFLPKQSGSLVHVETKNLLSAFERAMLMISAEDTRFPITLMTINDGQSLRLNIDTVRGSFHEDVEIELEGEAVECDFNPKFFMDALRTIDVDRISINFTGKVGPCVIRPENGDHFNYLLLPLRGH